MTLWRQVRRARTLASAIASEAKMSDLKSYNAKSGALVPVWTIEIQTLSEDTDRID